MPRDCCLENFNGVGGIKRVVQSPRHYGPGIHVDYRRQIHESLAHRDIRDVNGPDLPRTRHGQPSEQIWPDILDVAPFGEVAPGHQRNDAHLPHQSPYTFRPDDKVHCHKVKNCPHDTSCGIIRVNPVYCLHDGLIVFTLTLRLIIICPFAEGKDFQLSVDRQSVLAGD